MLRLNGQFNLNASVVCGDKSIAHRALIFASVADGTSVIGNMPLSADVLTTADCLRALGADIRFDGNTVTVEPIAEVKDNVTLNCANSGTTARLLAGLVAGLGVNATFIGDASLSKRPMDRVLQPLERMGAKFSKPKNCLFKCLGGTRLYGSTVYAAVDSAQVKSAVLIAGLFAEGSTTYVEKLSTRNHTELMLAALNANIKVDGQAVTVSKSRLLPIKTDIPCDVSSMSYLVAAAVITGKPFVCSNVLLNERRLGFVRVLQRAGADIKCIQEETRFGETVGSIIVKKSGFGALYASAADVCDAIDEVPLLAALSVTMRGTHVFEGVGELRHKESDRIKAVLHMAAACGQKAEYANGRLIVVSNGVLEKNPRFCSFDDHRIAMCEVVLCIASGGGSVDRAPFDVSFPQFETALGLNIYRLGLIGGTDIRKSLSPLLMEYLSTVANVNCSYDLLVQPDGVTDERLLDIISRYDGLNVTMPYKMRVAQLLNADCLSVNTVGRNVVPQSTDGYGMVTALRDMGVDFENKPLYVAGAGGAAALCVQTLLSYGCKIQILNRTKSHADVLINKFNLSCNVSNPYGMLSFVPECDYEKSLPLPDSCKFVFTAAYKGTSGLKDKALARGITYVDGLRMLYHQGAKSFALWTDTALQNNYGGFVEFLRSVQFCFN